MVNILEQSIEALTPIISEAEVLNLIGSIAGNCYGSKDEEEANKKRAINCISRGHHSPFEHFNITLKCIVDRGTTYAIVRHRHCAFTQSSTIYKRETGGLDIIDLPKTDPCSGQKVESISADELTTYEQQYITYTKMLNNGVAPARARDVLPNAMATTLIITTNLREWMFIRKRRNGPGDSVRMHVWDNQLDNWFCAHYPQITMAFDAWYDEHPL